MPTDLLAELKKLQYHRSDSSPFANHVEFHIWADRVLPLLSFDPKLHSQFKSMVSATKSARIFEIKQQEIENINSAIGMVNQAITLLEVNPVPNTASEPAVNVAKQSRPDQNRSVVWYEKPLGKIWLTIVGGVLTACAIYVLHLLGILI
jgi:hypothetical protein